MKAQTCPPSDMYGTKRARFTIPVHVPFEQQSEDDQRSHGEFGQRGRKTPVYPSPMANRRVNSRAVSGVRGGSFAPSHAASTGIGSSSGDGFGSGIRSRASGYSLDRLLSGSAVAYSTSRAEPNPSWWYPTNG